ncbi:MAG: enoyl-CoA hydratase/isomerase family protein [Alphaproteobacteria bacterium]|nr:enoyl-CoA hydratase/isomerase family protein [Alphaproteobacteria bacterium]
MLSRTEGGIGWITLNRPRALNALSLFMIRKLSHLLKEWEESPSLKAVVIEGAGEKAFCAGGDVRAVYEAKKEGRLETCDVFFREEYTLNAYIHSYPKPYISLIDGIAMGGGLGVSINGSYRLITERALLAMPETGIGFFPDVGATTFLTKAPGKTGVYLGLTGARLKAPCALWSGLGTHFIPSAALPAFKKDLSNGLEDALKNHCQPLLEKGFLEEHRDDIETHFSHPSVEDIFESLSHDDSSFAKETLTTLKTKSPTSLKVVFRQLTEATSTFEERMKTEFRLSQRFVEGHDFFEGVRAVLVDKDGAPQWKPNNLEAVTDKATAPYFAPLGERELIL